MRTYYQLDTEMGDGALVSPHSTRVSRQSPQRASISPSRDVGHAQEAGAHWLHCLMMPCKHQCLGHKPGISCTFSFAFDSPQQKPGSRRCFQQDCATGCQVKNDLSCYKQTKQSSFQDVRPFVCVNRDMSKHRHVSI